MVKANLFVCASRIIRDVESNLISVIDIFEEFRMVSFPAIIQPIVLLVVWERGKDDDNIQYFDLNVLCNGKEIQKFTQITINFQEKFKSRSIVTINGFIIPEPGEINLDVYFQKEKMQTYSILASLIQNTPKLTSL